VQRLGQSPEDARGASEPKRAMRGRESNRAGPALPLPIIIQNSSFKIKNPPSPRIQNLMLSYPYQFIKDLIDLKKSAAIMGWSVAFKNVIKPDTTPSWQFTKYLIIGSTSVVIFYLVYGMFRLSIETLMPGSFTTQRLFWNLLAIFVAFVPTNAFTYHTNRKWVFIDGRHSQKKEFTLFTSGAALAFVACQFVAWYLITFVPVNDLVVTLSVIVISTVMNFLFRKFIVFHN